MSHMKIYHRSNCKWYALNLMSQAETIYHRKIRQMLLDFYSLLTTFALFCLRDSHSILLLSRFDMVIESEERMPIAPSLLVAVRGFTWKKRVARNTRGLVAILKGIIGRSLSKVYTRNARGIRGHVEAYVVAFDKHWNLALEDCYEVWSRKVKRKAPVLGTIIPLKSRIIHQGS